MTNAIRGEAALECGGVRYTLLLTLGALADIEEGLGLSDLSHIGARLKQARACDIAVIAAALLKGGGHHLSPQDVLCLPLDLGSLLAAIATAFARAGLSKEPGENTAGPFAGPISSPSG
ncbi:hypothetical protein FHS83_000949 [Rhizomicrobium palustre]|uniref:Gene transfer agent family protein n=1 Tax=Rhizomicrobium palustre TaxID=189966 RepID=A0A846MWV6_9PROT|nr:GTA-gp10 family protein [Rhizomicrobium palustre]NIK87631.1 hypothetical protein [Rhizomicrobium palustre]